MRASSDPLNFFTLIVSIDHKRSLLCKIETNADESSDILDKEALRVSGTSRWWECGNVWIEVVKARSRERALILPDSPKYRGFGDFVNHRSLTRWIRNISVN